MDFSRIDRNQDFYTYSLAVSALAASGSTSVSFSIDTDSDFYLMKLTQQSDIAGAAQTNSSRVVPLVTVQVTDGGSSRQLFSQPVAIPAVFGNGENPYILPAPRMFAAGSTITVALVNYDAASTYNLRLAFTGIKQYRR